MKQYWKNFKEVIKILYLTILIGIITFTVPAVLMLIFQRWWLIFICIFTFPVTMPLCEIILNSLIDKRD